MEKLKCLASIGFFGFWGGISRYLIGLALNFWGTLLVNLLGCFLLALLTYFWLNFHDIANWLSLGLGTGFIGSFTTFSSFCLDSLRLLESRPLTAIIYLILSSGGGLLLAILGAWLGTYLGKKVKEREEDTDAIN